MKVIFTLSEVPLLLLNVLCYTFSNTKPHIEKYCRDQGEGVDYVPHKYPEISDAKMKRQNFRLKLPAALGIGYLN